MGGGGYVFDNGFLPKGVVVYADTCGVDFVPGNSGWETSVQRLDRAVDFGLMAKRRGGILTTREVYGEFSGLIKYFKINEKAFNERCDELYSQGGRVRDCVRLKGESYIAAKGASVYSKLRFDMRMNCGLVDRKSSGIPVGEIEDFFDECGIDLGERSVLVKMLSYEGESGFLSADRDALVACYDGLREFGVGGYVCDARDCSVGEVDARRIVAAFA